MGAGDPPSAASPPAKAAGGAEAPAGSLPEAPEPGALPAVVDTTLRFALEVGSRLYPDWHEDHVVPVGARFFIGDTPFTGEVGRFMPDFRIHEGRPANWSNRMNNPAVQVFVYGDSGAVDSTWAFLNFPPHYSPKAFFTFQLKEVRGYPDSASPPQEPKKEQ
jgi:hypothetical protein